MDSLCVCVVSVEGRSDDCCATSGSVRNNVNYKHRRFLQFLQNITDVFSETATTLILQDEHVRGFFLGICHPVRTLTDN